MKAKKLTQVQRIGQLEKNYIQNIFNTNGVQ